MHPDNLRTMGSSLLLRAVVSLSLVSLSWIILSCIVLSSFDTISSKDRFPMTTEGKSEMIDLLSFDKMILLVKSLLPQYTIAPNE